MCLPRVAGLQQPHSATAGVWAAILHADVHTNTCPSWLYRAQVVAALLTHSSYRPLAGHVSMLCAQLRDSSQHPEPRPMPQQHPALSAHEDVGDLLRHVLHALAYQFDPDHQCISIIRSGLFMPRNGVQWRGRQAQAVKRRFYIEDPLVRNHCSGSQLVV